MPKPTNFRQPPNLPELEEQIMQFWDKTKAFEKSVEMRSADQSYVFYDGPPFATGMPHYGHLLASTTKDIFPRYHTMKGFRVERVWGWDCHGLPIENMIEKKLDIKGGKKGIEALGIDKFNDACQLEVLRLDKEWEKIINRLGRWVDFENNYKTMDTSFMESVWWAFQRLNDKGLVYEGKRVILYCPRCATPLSNFEIAMDNSYITVDEPSTTYKYKVVGAEDTYLLAWSTTPWNKLATPALAVHPDLTYVQVAANDEHYILVKTRLEAVMADMEYTVEKELTGQELTELEYELHFDFYPDRADNERAGVVVADKFVSDEDGTGIVTLAVYGEDDLRVMQREQVQLVEHVDEEGNLKPAVTPWAGRNIWEINAEVDADLAERGLLFKHEPHSHNVPTCYRCSTRLYHAPVPAWFIDVQKLKDQLLAHNENINWYPDHLKHGRFGKGLETAPDWNISRSRYWGTPMPVWRAEDGTTRIIGSIEELQQWAVNPDEVKNLTDIHRQYVDDIAVYVDDAKTKTGTRIPEVFDCWVESGSMPFASRHYPFADKQGFEQNYPAQFISEYIAQTRAWFYCMHVISVGLFDKPAFENALTTGTILAEDGTKMSKSKKNYPDPMELINNYGVDSLRLYLMQSVVMKADNLNFSEKEVSDIRRKVFVIWWNMLSFYETFGDTTANWQHPPTEPTHVMDKWLLSKTHHLINQVTTAMDNYDIVGASRMLMEFVNELSTWYVRQSRNRLKAEDNQEVSQVYGFALYTLAQLFAPITPYFAELVHHTMVDEQSSIHHTDWPVANEAVLHPELEEKMAEVRKAVERAHAVRSEAGLKVRQPLASATVTSPVAAPKDNLLAVMAQEINVKEVFWQQGSELEVVLDTELTPDLKAEGEARELIRNLQRLRKKAGLKVGELAVATAPNWPAEWEDQIKEKANLKELKVGELEVVKE